MTKDTLFNTSNGAQKSMGSNEIVFLCGARDFHAMDWYRSALKIMHERDIVILTDLIESEGFKRLINDKDILYKLLVIDRILFKGQSRKADVWRNIVKAVLFPIQVMLLRRFACYHKGALYHAHSMYYLWLAWAAGLEYVGIPQGSDILVKPLKSNIYRVLSVAALKAATAVSVDSKIMAEYVYKMAGVKAAIIQNGIDVNAINTAINGYGKIDQIRYNITSFRGLTPLYNIITIIHSRNASSKYREQPVNLIYPFYEQEYAMSVRSELRSFDRDLGRVDRNEIYRNFLSTLLAISIPYSDSSPRSVYEAIFCGSAVALAYHPFIDDMPECMKSRIIIIDLQNSKWFDEALDAAIQITKEPFRPSLTALDMFDQEKSFLRLFKLVSH
jgi:hypothetical protein